MNQILVVEDEETISRLICARRRGGAPTSTLPTPVSVTR